MVVFMATFETEEAALASDDAGAKVLPLGEALSAERKVHAEALSNAHRAFAELRDAVTEHLDAVDGAIDADEFIEEHRELAEAIGYEFEEEKTYLIEVQVTAKVKRGYDDVAWSSFELDVDSVDDNVQVLDFEVRDCNEY